LIRPLLGVRKRECEAFCRAAGVTWREDPTNANPVTARGRLRRDVIPVLDQLWPGAADRMQASSWMLSAAVDLIRAEVERMFGPPRVNRWSRAELRKCAEAIIGSGLRRAAVQLTPACADALTQQALLDAARAVRSAERKPRSFEWPCGVRLRIAAREVTLDLDTRESSDHGESTDA
jgi:tRNA(Ile)-lysidine synthase TilS/MesJ